MKKTVTAQELIDIIKQGEKNFSYFSVYLWVQEAGIYLKLEIQDLIYELSKVKVGDIILEDRMHGYLWIEKISKKAKINLEVTPK